MRVGFWICRMNGSHRRQLRRLHARPGCPGRALFCTQRAPGRRTDQGLAVLVWYPPGYPGKSGAGFVNDVQALFDQVKTGVQTLHAFIVLVDPPLFELADDVR